MLVNGVILASVTTAFQVVVLLLNALTFSSERLVVVTVFEDFGLNSHDGSNRWLDILIFKYKD